MPRRIHGPAAISLSVFFTLLLLGCNRSSDVAREDEDAAQQVAGTVTIRIVSDEKDVVEIEIPDVASGESLENVMRQIKECPIEISGSGETAFVQSIDGLDTEGGQGWTFQVDGEFANQGVGKTLLSPPTTVEWSYGGF